MLDAGPPALCDLRCGATTYTGADPYIQTCAAGEVCALSIDSTTGLHAIGCAPIQNGAFNAPTCGSCVVHAEDGGGPCVIPADGVASCVDVQHLTCTCPENGSGTATCTATP